VRKRPTEPGRVGPVAGPERAGSGATGLRFDSVSRASYAIGFMVVFRNDPSPSSPTWLAGAWLPFSAEHRIQDTAIKGTDAPKDSL
jgi:hypothetical protein